MPNEVLSTSDQGSTDAGTETDQSAVNTDTTQTEQSDNQTDVLSGNTDKEGDKADDGSDKQEGEKKDGDKKESPEVPENYDLKAPENFQIDQKELDYWSPIFKDMKLTNEQAQQFVNAAPEYLTNAVNQALESQVSEFESIQQQQFADLQKDPDFGGSHWEQTQLEAKTAFSEFATPDEIEYIQQTGQANSPALIKIFARIGKAMSDTQLGSGSNHASVSAADLYPNSKMNP